MVGTARTTLADTETPRARLCPPYRLSCELDQPERRQREQAADHEDELRAPRIVESVGRRRQQAVHHPGAGVRRIVLEEGVELLLIAGVQLRGTCATGPISALRMCRLRRNIVAVAATRTDDEPAMQLLAALGYEAIARFDQASVAALGEPKLPYLKAAWHYARGEAAARCARSSALR